MYRAELAKRDEGFGCLLSSRGGRLYVRAASGPAEGAGVREGDELLGVNDEYFRKRTTLDDAVSMLAEASRVALLLRRGPCSSGAPPPPPGAPRPAGEAEEVRAEAARAKWARAEAARAEMLARAIERETKQQEAAAEAAEKLQRKGALRAAARAAEAKEEEDRHRAERAALDDARAQAEAERAALATERAGAEGAGRRRPAKGDARCGHSNVERSARGAAAAAPIAWRHRLGALLLPLLLLSFVLFMALPAQRPVSIIESCLLYTSPSPRDRTRSRMPSSA